VSANVEKSFKTGDDDDFELLTPRSEFFYGLHFVSVSVTGITCMKVFPQPRVCVCVYIYVCVCG
jgi:hypothetical protein